MSTDVTLGMPPPVARSRNLRDGPWSPERLPLLVAARAEAVRDAVLAPLLAELDREASEALRGDRDGWAALLERLEGDLDLCSAVRLLLRDQPGASRPPVPDPAWEEAAIDAASPTESLFDRRCAAGCAALAAAAVSRAAMPEAVRRRLLALLPGAPSRAEGEAALVEALVLGRSDAVIALLSAATGLTGAAIANALATDNRRGLVALAWKAGYGMRTARLLQVLAAGIEPDHALVADADGGCPLGRAEMAWQLAFMERAALP